MYKLRFSTSYNSLHLSVEKCILMNLYFIIHNLNISNILAYHIHCKLYFFNEKATCRSIYFHYFVENYDTFNAHLYLILKV